MIYINAIIALLKPHYQADKRQLIKGVLPVESAELIKAEVCEKIKNLGFTIKDETASPILGGAGNTEYLLLIEPVVK